MKDRYILRLEQQDKRLKLKQALVDLKGGCCSNCQYSKCLSALEFHHIDESRKEFSISQTTNLAAAKKEIESCVLLCANCHREVHAGLLVGFLSHSM